MNALTNDTEDRPDERRPRNRKAYTGCRGPEGCVVWVTDGTSEPKPLDPCWELRNHSPTGFEWGYGGSGPAQLALAILADHLDDDRAALNLYQRFQMGMHCADTRRQLVAIQRGDRQLPRPAIATARGH
jgi:Family of unknown function (DUF6166)